MSRTFDPDKPDDTQKPDVEGPGAREGEATGTPPTSTPDREAPDRQEADREALGGNDDATRRRTTGETQGKPTDEGR